MSIFLNKKMLASLTAAALLSAVIFILNNAYSISLRDVQYFNGWVLLTLIVAMLFLTIRKKLVILPFGRTKHWLQLHYYLGLITLVAFLIHTDLRLPNAPAEWVLWLLFCLVAVSGLFGGLVSKVVPKRLEEHDNQISFENLPSLRAQLAEQAEALAMSSLQGGDSRSLAELYVDRLHHFFAAPRNIWAHLRLSDLPLARILGEVDSIQRYLDDTGQARLDEMKSLVKAKNALDFHYAHGSVLKFWLFVHVPQTYAMIVFILVHVAIAYGFSSGIA
ncbi:hypothetical protein [Labrenzia sp. PHM005]|uniref:hypothetical protein n=1 Tax=Labrenzia sp. PHM005 TaxID=2590016 RepID=UPI0011408430|nr:hypothetical protein [Labrenzia sp. PHM005]QDG78495.1 hypothetical protein FJ695_23000 [Labrenzia sp. PHM005]